MCAGDIGLEHDTTAHTAGLVQKEMADFHRDRWQLNHLMGVGTRGGGRAPWPQAQGVG
jgi:hypothetical protein